MNTSSSRGPDLLDWSACLSKLLTYKTRCTEADNLATDMLTSNSGQPTVDVSRLSRSKLNDYRKRIIAGKKASALCHDLRDNYKMKCIQPENRNEGHNKAIQFAADQVSKYDAVLLEIAKRYETLNAANAAAAAAEAAAPAGQDDGTESEQQQQQQKNKKQQDKKKKKRKKQQQQQQQQSASQLAMSPESDALLEQYAVSAAQNAAQRAESVYDIVGTWLSAHLPQQKLQYLLNHYKVLVQLCYTFLGGRPEVLELGTVKNLLKGYTTSEDVMAVVHMAEELATGAKHRQGPPGDASSSSSQQQQRNNTVKLFVLQQLSDNDARLALEFQLHQVPKNLEVRGLPRACLKVSRSFVQSIKHLQTNKELSGQQKVGSILRDGDTVVFTRRPMESIDDDHVVRELCYEWAQQGYGSLGKQKVKEMAHIRWLQICQGRELLEKDLSVPTKGRYNT